MTRFDSRLPLTAAMQVSVTAPNSRRSRKPPGDEMTPSPMLERLYAAASATMA
jgi:hypothetical protein